MLNISPTFVYFMEYCELSLILTAHEKWIIVSSHLCVLDLQIVQNLSKFAPAVVVNCFIMFYYVLLCLLCFTMFYQLNAIKNMRLNYFFDTRFFDNVKPQKHRETGGVCLGLETFKVQFGLFQSSIWRVQSSFQFNKVQINSPHLQQFKSVVEYQKVEKQLVIILKCFLRRFAPSFRPSSLKFNSNRGSSKFNLGQKKSKLQINSKFNSNQH